MARTHTSRVSITFLALTLVLHVLALPSPILSHENRVSSHTVRLTRRSGPKQLTRPFSRRDAGSSKLLATAFGLFFSTNVTIGNQSFELVVDTGSSTQWVVTSDFNCLNDESIGPCNYGPIYNISPTFDVIEDLTFAESYGSGEQVAGIVGYDEVTIAGIKIQKQEIGLAKNGSFVAPDEVSGLIGIAYAGARYSNGQVIIPTFTNMYEEGLVEPLFSLALDRMPFNTSTGSGGWLAFGGLPPVPHSKQFARTPITRGLGSEGNDNTGKPEHVWYSILIEGITYGKCDEKDPTQLQFNNTQYEMIVDSGTAQNMFPPETAATINALFDPPGILDENSGFYVVECNSRPPQLGVKIGGVTFYHKPEDLIVADGAGTCYSTIARNTDLVIPSGDTVSILGDAFLKNVVAVFDVGGEEMRFAAREDS